MPALLTRWKLAAAGLAAYAAFAWYFGGEVVGQRRAVAQEKEKPAVKKDGPTPMYFGVAACNNKGCHGGEPPAKWIKDKDLLCRCVEAMDWDKKDKHADAYRVLTGPRGQQMARILGYDVTKADACLACHGVIIKDERLLTASKENQFKIEEGVNCVACHGAYEEWVGRHGVLVTARKWRPLSREEKEDKGGMRNLWDPIKRAELCVSCHVGSIKERKFVTHDMYAAGHPPLPGFEAAAFSDQMPRHWQYLQEKSKAIKEELGYKPGEQEQAKLILIGAAVALRETMDLLEQQAKKCREAKEDDDRALDLANFDCYACHHDLKAPSWRQKRGYAGKPGRILMRPWSTELIKLAVEATPPAPAKSLEVFDKLLKEVNGAFTAQPFGDPKKIEPAAAAMKKWAGDLAKKLDAKEVTIDAKAARKLLESIPTLYGGTAKKPVTLDYDSARQVGWAAEVLAQELGEDKTKPKVKKALEDLDDHLKLRLPKGRAKKVEDDLEASLKKINNYDPEQFRKLLGDLSAALKSARSLGSPGGRDRQ
jgi:hypothetical protein